MRRRTIWIATGVVMFAAAVVAAFLLRSRAAPEPARLLPEADAYLYLNLKPLRTLGVIGEKTPPVHEAEYEEFVRETGFQFERDLDEAAFAIHAPPRLVDAPEAGGRNAFRRYSEVFRGRFDAQRAHKYFRKIAQSVETYRNVTIYNIPLEGRTVRVALLGVGIAAVSNTDGPAAIHYMIDRYKELALPFGGPALVREYYRRVPLGSLMWAMARTGSDAGGGTPLMLPGGFDLFFPSDTVVVGSVRYTTAIHVKAEAFTANADQAKQIVDQAGAFLSIMRGLQNTMSFSGTDADVKAFFDSLAVEQNDSRAVLSATVPAEFLKKLFAEPPTGQITGAQPPEPPKKPAGKGKRRQK
ncbi:MAG: hypothetical protein ACE14L_03785 [Terriglobales bacterium]